MAALFNWDSVEQFDESGEYCSVNGVGQAQTDPSRRDKLAERNFHAGQATENWLDLIPAERACNLVSAPLAHRDMVNALLMFFR